MPLSSVISQTLHIPGDGKRKQTLDQDSVTNGVTAQGAVAETVADSGVKPANKPHTGITVTSGATQSKALRILLITLVNSTYLIRKND